MAAIGTYGWIPFLVAGSGNILGGMVSGHLVKRGLPVGVARKTSISLFALLMLAAIPAVLAPSAAAAIAWVSVAMTGYTGALASMLALPADVFPKNSVASVYGIASMGSGFGGMVFTLITGWVVQNYSWTPVFCGFGVIPLICATILWTVTPDGARSAIAPVAISR
jgi:ACS family hexuronate transporter-like MFS transporter